jgi:hypothetical protein
MIIKQKLLSSVMQFPIRFSTSLERLQHVLSTFTIVFTIFASIIYPDL